jgi:hypothetical protein
MLNRKKKTPDEKETELLIKNAKAERDQELSDLIYAYRILDENYIRFQMKWNRDV